MELITKLLANSYFSSAPALNSLASVCTVSLAHFGGELVDVLVGEGQAEAVFAGFGQDGGEAVGGEIVELVDEQVKIPSLADLTTDFLIAISQAVFFGLSMIWVETYLIWLGLLLSLAFARQYRKVQQLAKFFYERFNPPEVTESREEKAIPFGVRGFVAAVRATKKEHMVGTRKVVEFYLDGWVTVSWWYGIAIGALWAIAFCISKGWVEKLGRLLSGRDVDPTACYAVIYLVIGIGVFWVARGTLKRKSISLDDHGQPVIRRMDPAARELALSLKGKLQTT